jgi:DNA-directed RNA polymerase subunit RPC12/RpoP
MPKKNSNPEESITLDMKPPRKKRVLIDNDFVSTDKNKKKIVEDDPYKLYECRFANCSYKTFDKKKIINHNSTHLNSTYTCTKCGKEFDRDRKLNEHLWEEHGIKRSGSNRSGVWTCKYEGCGETFKKRDEMWKHKNDNGHTNT